MYQCQINISETVFENIIPHFKSSQLPTGKIQLDSTFCIGGKIGVNGVSSCKVALKNKKPKFLH